jgi:hypothetical protein
MFEKTLTLSTAHLPSTDPNFGAHRAVEWELGYFVFVTPVTKETPAWLRPIMRLGVDARCALILFDRDGEVNSAYRAYDW